MARKTHNEYCYNFVSFPLLRFAEYLLEYRLRLTSTLQLSQATLPSMGTSE